MQITSGYAFSLSGFSLKTLKDCFTPPYITNSCISSNNKRFNNMFVVYECGITAYYDITLFLKKKNISSFKKIYSQSNSLHYTCGNVISILIFNC